MVALIWDYGTAEKRAELLRYVNDGVNHGLRVVHEVARED